MNDKPTLRIIANDCEFVLPYIAREMPDFDLVGTDTQADYSVFITQDKSRLAEKPADAAGFFCPNIVGTGMNGKPMEIAKAIAGGRLYHIAGNTARISTVHASDVARAVVLAYNSAGNHTITDLADPTYEQLAEALATRIQGRRIYRLKGFWTRLLMTRELISLITTDDLTDGADFAAQFDFRPTPVTEYLTTHVYDDESL